MSSRIGLCDQHSEFSNDFEFLAKLATQSTESITTSTEKQHEEHAKSVILTLDLGLRKEKLVSYLFSITTITGLSISHFPSWSLSSSLMSLIVYLWRYRKITGKATQVPAQGQGDN